MRRVLVLGGTGWLGRQVAEAARDAGDHVVCLARGESGPVPDGVELVRADRTAPDAYEEVDGDWDEVVELAYQPGLVVPALEALADRAAHWTLVSTVSVYADSRTAHADETAELVEPRDLSDYPDAKVAAERATSRHLGERLLIARPGLIVGPGDPSDRFGYWPARLSRGGQVLIPTPAGRFVQVIHVADLAHWIAKAGREGTTGAINAVGPVHTMEEFFRTADEVTGFEGDLVSVDDETLLAQDVGYWAGPRSLPLWLPLEDTGFARRDGGAYLASGGVHRPLSTTLAETLDDEVARGLDRPRRSGLTASEEEAILNAVR